jgi:predicted extracellular nuclease
VDNTLRAGDTTASVTGVVDYGLATSSNTGAGDYKVQVLEPVIFSRDNARTEAPARWGNLKVASFNVLNFFTTFTDGSTADGQSGQGCSLDGSVSASNCRGASNIAEFTRQRDKIVAAIAAIDADALGLMEMQNNGATAVQNLVDALNAKVGPAPTPSCRPGRRHRQRRHQGGDDLQAGPPEPRGRGPVGHRPGEQPPAAGPDLRRAQRPALHPGGQPPEVQGQLPVGR